MTSKRASMFRSLTSQEAAVMDRKQKEAFMCIFLGLIVAHGNFSFEELLRAIKDMTRNRQAHH